MYALAMNIGKDLEKLAKDNRPWTDRTGHTRLAIHGGADRDGRGVILYLAHGSKIGWYLEEGTGIYGPKGRPFEIRPKNKKALRFFSNGNEIFAKSVMHPGMEARPIIEPTIESNWPRIKQQVRRYWEGS